jgi:hypothetical protein
MDPSETQQSSSPQGQGGEGGGEEYQEQEMPILSCEIEEMGSEGKVNGKGKSPELPVDEFDPDADVDPDLDAEDETPSWPIFENISNGYFLESLGASDEMDHDNDNGSLDQGQSDPETELETEGDGDESQTTVGPASGVPPEQHPLIAEHGGRIFNSRTLSMDEKHRLALEGNPGFKYRKMYSSGQKSYKCW